MTTHVFEGYIVEGHTEEMRKPAGTARRREPLSVAIFATPTEVSSAVRHGDVRADAGNEDEPVMGQAGAHLSERETDRVRPTAGSVHTRDKRPDGSHSNVDGYAGIR